MMLNVWPLIRPCGMLPVVKPETLGSIYQCNEQIRDRDTDSTEESGVPDESVRLVGR